MLLPVTLACLVANAIGGLLAPGWIGVGGDDVVRRWRWWGTVTPLAAAILGVGATIALVIAAVANPRTSVSTRLVATFGAGLVLTFVAAALRNVLEPTHLIVLFAGAFAVLVAGGVEALTPPATRALGVLLGLLALSAVLRVGAWGVAWSAARRGVPIQLGTAQGAATGAIVFEMIAQAFVVVYLLYRPGWRGAIGGVLAVGAAFMIAAWALGATFDGHGTLRDALQRALSLRVHGGGPAPSWLGSETVPHEIALLDRNVRVAFLPLVFAELSSITLAVGALLTASRATLPVMAAVALALLSRGQVDAPLRALELVIAALAALVLARGARVRGNGRGGAAPSA